MHNCNFADFTQVCRRVADLAGEFCSVARESNGQFCSPQESLAAVLRFSSSHPDLFNRTDQTSPSPSSWPRYISLINRVDRLSILYIFSSPPPNLKTPFMMSEHEGEGLLDSYRCLGNDWLSGAESAGTDKLPGVPPGAAHKGPGGGDGAGLLHSAHRDTEEEMEADSGGSGAYLLSASRVTSNSSDCTDTTSAACSSSSSSDNSDDDGDDGDDGYMTYKGGAGTEEHTYLNSQWDTTDAPGEMQRPQARRAQPVVPPSSPSSSSSSLSVPPQRAAQAVAKAQHGLRATRSRLSINSLPNLLKEKTDELDLDYREINVNELDLEEKPVGKYARRYQPLAMLATTDCLRARACVVCLHRGAFGTIYKGSWRGAKVRSSVIHFLHRLPAGGALTRVFCAGGHQKAQCSIHD